MKLVSFRLLIATLIVLSNLRAARAASLPGDTSLPA